VSIASSLAFEDYEIDTATDGLDALDKLDRVKPDLRDSRTAGSSSTTRMRTMSILSRVTTRTAGQEVEGIFLIELSSWRMSSLRAVPAAIRRSPRALPATVRT
jgi:hypothetical protein